MKSTLRTKKKLSVVHICVTDQGGAGLCCRRIHKALTDLDVESHIITMLKYSNDNNVIRVKWGFKWFIYRAINKILLYLNLPLTDRVKIKILEKKINEPLSIPVTVFSSLYKHPLIKQADIIHLHSVTGFIDYPSFFKKIRKPIVWTLHDDNLFNGLSHLSRTNLDNNDLNKKYYEIKLSSIKKAENLGIVFLSEMKYDKFHNNEMVKGRKMIIINNPVNTYLFKPKDKIKARNSLGIPNNAKVFIFVAASIDDPWKGFNKLPPIIKNMNIPNVLLLVVGKINKTNIKQYSFVKYLGPIYDSEQLSTAYSAADFFISTSYQEAFAQTPIEAMACGIPAILTPVSGAKELINKDNGILCKDFSDKAIEDGIKEALNIHYDPVTIRKDVWLRFSNKKIATQYLDFYQSLL